MFEDIKFVLSKLMVLPNMLFKGIWHILKLFGRIFKPLKQIFLWLNPIGWFKKKEKIIAQSTEPAIAKTKTSIVKKLNYMMSPKAKLTYWLGDEQVTVYVASFAQKDKFKLVYKDLYTGRMVMVNGAEPIIYRLEELRPDDVIEATKIQQNQKF